MGPSQDVLNYFFISLEISMIKRLVDNETNIRLSLTVLACFSIVCSKKFQRYLGAPAFWIYPSSLPWSTSWPIVDFLKVLRNDSISIASTDHPRLLSIHRLNNCSFFLRKMILRNMALSLLGHHLHAGSLRRRLEP